MPGLMCHRLYLKNRGENKCLRGKVLGPRIPVRIFTSIFEVMLRAFEVKIRAYEVKSCAYEAKVSAYEV